MKFNKEKLSEIYEVSETNNSEINKQNLDAREKRVTMMEYSAVIMLVFAIIAFALGARFFDKMYKKYNTISKSTVYNGIINKDNENDTLKETQKLMNEVENLYENCYTLDIERENIDEYVLNALISAYGDKYAVYRDPSETIQNYNSKSSHISGIGVLCTSEMYNNTDHDKYDIYLIDVYDGSPAQDAGLEVGDRITKVNGKELSLTKYNFSEANNDIRGEIGTNIELTFEDASDNFKEKVVTITRNNTSVNTIRYRKVTDDIGYIVIRGFESDTDEQFLEAMNYFESQNVNKIIFDLRNNGGGLAETCVNMLDILLPEGLIIKQYDKNGNLIETNNSDKNHKEFTSVCLINTFTASASEMFTQSLIDYNLTTTIGEKSYGKGTVCTTFNLSNGGSLTMSTGNYLTKSGKIIENVGIDPDIEMKLDKDKQSISYKLTDDEDDLIQMAIKVLQK